MSTRRGKAIFGSSLVVFGLVVFMLASAYLIERDQPKWLAAAIGGLAFPVLPLAWHVIGERRRRSRLSAAKLQPKNPLAPGDRYLLRAIGIAILVLGPMFAIGRFGVVRAAWANKTWFLPGPDPIEQAEELLAHVPSDAKAVILIRDHDSTKKHHGANLAVIALSDHDLAMIAPEDDDETQSESDRVKQLNDQRGKLPFLKLDAVAAVDLGKHVFAVATERWRGKLDTAGVGPSLKLRDELAKAPGDAIVAIAYVPPAPELGVEKVSGWVMQKATNEKLTVELQIDAVDAPAAEKAIELAKSLWKSQRSQLPESCQDVAGKIVDNIELAHAGAKVTFHLDIQPDQLVGMLLCAMKKSD